MLVVVCNACGVDVYTVAQMCNESCYWWCWLQLVELLAYLARCLIVTPASPPLLILLLLSLIFVKCKKCARPGTLHCGEHVSRYFDECYLKR